MVTKQVRMHRSGLFLYLYYEQMGEKYKQMWEIMV